MFLNIFERQQSPSPSNFGDSSHPSHLPALSTVLTIERATVKIRANHISACRSAFRIPFLSPRNEAQGARQTPNPVAGSRLGTRSSAC